MKATFHIKNSQHISNTAGWRKRLCLVLLLASIAKWNIVGSETNYTDHCSNQCNKTTCMHDLLLVLKLYWGSHFSSHCNFQILTISNRRISKSKRFHPHCFNFHAFFKHKIWKCNIYPYWSDSKKPVPWWLFASYNDQNYYGFQKYKMGRDWYFRVLDI